MFAQTLVWFRKYHCEISGFKGILLPLEIECQWLCKAREMTERTSAVSMSWVLNVSTTINHISSNWSQIGK